MYGGQAVMEGVMMRSPSFWAVAVRKPNGELADVWQPINSPMKRHWVFRLPVIRGVMALGESLGIGFRALAISTRFATEGEDGEEGFELGGWAIAAMSAIGWITPVSLLASITETSGRSARAMALLRA